MSDQVKDAPLRMFEVENNFPCICEDCLGGEYQEFDLHQPAFRKEITTDQRCEICDY